MAKTKPKEQHTSIEDLQDAANEAAANADAAAGEASRLTAAAHQAAADADARAAAAQEEAAAAAAEVIRLQHELAEKDLALKVAAAALAQKASAEVAEAAAEAQADADAAALKAAELAELKRPTVPSFRMESGGWAPLASGFGPRDFRIKAADGTIWDHCADTANGDWVYRRA